MKMRPNLVPRNFPKEKVMGNETKEKLIVCKRDDVTEITILISAHYFKKIKNSRQSKKTNKSTFSVPVEKNRKERKRERKYEITEDNSFLLRGRQSVSIYALLGQTIFSCAQMLHPGETAK